MQYRIDEKPKDVKGRILGLFGKVKRKCKEVLDESDVINLDDKSIAYVIGELQNYCLIEAERDIIADAFETFIGRALKGGQGQFFTPRNVVKMMVEILDPNDEDLIIDQACGSGGFLIESLRHVWRKLDTDGEKYHWNKNNLQEEKMEVALNRIKGIDKDYFLSKVAKAYMAIIGDGKSGIVCDDSLEKTSNWKSSTNQKIHLGNFSVLLTNPPFGSKIPVRGEEKLKQFELGHKWKFNKKNCEWEKGKLGIVLPDGIYGNDQLGYIRQYIKENMIILAIIDIPKETFQPNTSTKTTILIAEKKDSETQVEKNHNVFMAICETCGHNRRGDIIPDDDISLVSNEYKKFLTNPGKL